jgi:hypothetical protein
MRISFAETLKYTALILKNGLSTWHGPENELYV